MNEDYKQIHRDDDHLILNGNDDFIEGFPDLKGNENLLNVNFAPKDHFYFRYR